MKKIYILLVSTLITSMLNAQNITLQETKKQYGDENYSSWVAEVEEVDADFARKSFSRYAKEQLDLKMHKHLKNGLIAKEVKITQVYPSRRADLVANFNEQGESSELAISFVMGYDIILNSEDNPAEMQNFRLLASDIIFNIYQDYYEQQIKDLETEKKEINKKIAKNDRTKKSLTKKIQKNQKAMNQEGQVNQVELEADNIGYQANITAIEEMNQRLRDEISKLDEHIKQFLNKVRTLNQKRNEVEKPATQPSSEVEKTEN